MHVFQMVAAWTLAVATTAVSAFQSTTSSNTMPSRHHHHHQSILWRNNDQQNTIILHQSTENVEDEEYEEEEEYEMVEFFVSPDQISLLRKEAIKRDSSKKLPKFYLPPDESMFEITESSTSITDISKLFETSELIEVRGVAKGHKKAVFDTAHGMAGMLEDAFEKPVVVVDIKGFAAKLYCPWDSDDDGVGQRIQLRSSYKPGQWARKAKPIRDIRGQIILDEKGKSIKEIPE